MDRRQFLKGAAAGTAVVAGGVVIYEQSGGDGRSDGDADGETPTSRATQTPEGSTASADAKTPPETEPAVRHAEEFGTVVDAVQAGADSSGEEPIGQLLTDHAADDTLIAFPAGTYRLPRVELQDYAGLAISAAHEERPTFVAPAGSCTNSDPHVQFAGVEDFLLEGIDFDFSREGAGGAINVIANGDATVRDVSATGSCRPQVTMFRIDIRNEEGTGLVENLRARSGQDSGWTTGAYVGTRHAGEVTFRDCDLSEFTDNGLYGSAPGLDDDGGGGVVHSEACSFENNNVSNIRLGTPGSTAVGDTVVVESAPQAERLNLRGVRLRRGHGQRIEDCDIRFGPEITNSFGGIVFHADNGGATVSDSRITMDSSGIPAIRTFYHSDESSEPPVFENLTIDGGADRGFAVQINGRNGATIRNCEITQEGSRRDGVRIAYSDDCELVDSRIEVTGYPLILRDATVTIRNTTLVTPDGERYIEEMEAETEDFRP